MQVRKVLVADPISQRGLDEIAVGGELEVVLKTGLSETEIIKIIPDFSALVVRSQTKVTAAVLEAAKKLTVVGRAGVGVDNVDIEAATQARRDRHEYTRREHDFHGRTRLFAACLHCAGHTPSRCQRESRQVGSQEV